jgi:hypothetical protein
MLDVTELGANVLVRANAVASAIVSFIIVSLFTHRTTAHRLSAVPC